MKFDKAGAVKKLTNELKELEKTLDAVKKHKESDCAAGDHLCRGFATGGRDGHYLTYCLCCDYSVNGYD